MKKNTSPPGFYSMNRKLTARELQIVMLVHRAYKNSEIGRELGISEQTVKLHIYRIYNKSGLSNRVELALAVERGALVEAD